MCGPATVSFVVSGTNAIDVAADVRWGNDAQSSLIRIESWSGSARRRFGRCHHGESVLWLHGSDLRGNAGDEKCE
jgi:hypothetical protein